MKMHLFLEGPVKTGKSTLIRECLSPYTDQIGGFSSQRLWEEGRPCGYRLTPASEPQLDAPYDADAAGIFTCNSSKISRKDPQVFEQLGIELLTKSRGKPLILLDEIGGSELLVPAFREKLYETLAGPTPCIGVLKLASKARFMSRSAGYPGEVVAYNEQLRNDLTEQFSAKILAFSSENRSSVKKEIELFLERIFCHVGNV